MISKFSDINGLLEEIDKNLKRKVHFFIMGGAMLLYHGLKIGTKDIDIIVSVKEEYVEAERILKEIKFEGKIPTKEYDNLNLSQIFVRRDFRIDLFHKVVCKGFSLSSGMIKRSLRVIELKNLKVSLCSKEDVFLFKTFTEREGDVPDCINLARGGLDWVAIVDELKAQIKESGNNVWVTMVGERLQYLEEKGMEIPIMPQIEKLVEEYFDNLEKRENN